MGTATFREIAAEKTREKKTNYITDGACKGEVKLNLIKRERRKSIIKLTRTSKQGSGKQRASKQINKSND